MLLTQKQCLVSTFWSMLSENVTWSNLFWVVHPGGRSILDNI
jgi:predicted naringenin-chalcone synthase